MSEQRSSARGRNGSRRSCKYLTHRNVGGKEDLKGPPQVGLRGHPFWGLTDDRTVLYCISLRYKEMQNVQCCCLSRTICAWKFKALKSELFNAAVKSGTLAEDPDIRSRHTETMTKSSGINKNMEGPGNGVTIYSNLAHSKLFGETGVLVL